MVAPATSSAAPFQTLHALRKIAWPRTFLPLHPTSRMAMVGFRNESEFCIPCRRYIYMWHPYLYIYMNELISILWEWKRTKQVKKKEKNQFCFQNIHFSPFYFHFQSSSSRSTRILSILFHRYTLSLSIHEYWKTKKQKIAKSNSTHDNNHQFTLFAVTQ